MTNAQELKLKNINKFVTWRDSRTNADYRKMEFRGSLNRNAVAKGCDFAKSVLLQDPVVKKLLAELESELRDNGVLPPLRGNGYN